MTRAHFSASLRCLVILISALASLLFSASILEAQSQETARLSGRVIDAATGEAPTTSWTVWIYDENGEPVGGASSEFAIDGRFEFPNFGYEVLPTGRYFLVASGSPYIPESFGGTWCPASPDAECDPTTGTPIDVTVGEETGDLDFALDRGARSISPSAKSEPASTSI